MNVIVFGATGMVGAGVLIECLEDPRVQSILVVGRTPCGVTNPKLSEIIRSDFFDYSDVKADLKGHDACSFCLPGGLQRSRAALSIDQTIVAQSRDDDGKRWTGDDPGSGERVLEARARES